MPWLHWRGWPCLIPCSMVFFAFACVAGFVFLSYSARNPPSRPNPPPVPAYPRIEGDYGTEVRKNVNGADEEQVTRFDTVDAPEAVLQFYRDNLHEWRAVSTRQNGKTEQSLTLYFTNTCPFHSFDIKVQPRDGGGTRVETVLGRTLCR